MHAAPAGRFQRIEHARARVAALQQVQAKFDRVSRSGERDLVDQRSHQLAVRGQQLGPAAAGIGASDGRGLWPGASDGRGLTIGRR
eukprot:CAMPEP_0202791214 /NCGR_PEP_ID=MMETSP1388-20130828/81094_1 /ASSEMBLY_ACC=CAM_ASM_000864 /TAXON_ID=37098 /ORGANISM="Isochrysis sp, Strain CCMP1244" /LENGTH=85 /DNA_ID=CAMNT_0049460973 /DNA_START=44 /DNA_END=301 /DNA_ORIENTATION=-